MELRKMSKENKENKENKEFNKIKNSINFLKEINEKMSKEDINKIYTLYFKNYKNNNKERVISRNIFYKNNKVNEIELKEKREILISKLKEVNINYYNLIDKIKLLKNNRNKSYNIIEIKNLKL
jgi:hypothetical protein